jgi:hypothetical protein
VSKNHIFLIVMIIMLVTGCTSVVTKDIEVEAAADPRVDFSGYKSYAWLGSAAIVNDAYGQWESPAFDADAEITFLLDRELRARGMSEDNATPDLVVAFAAGIDMDALGLKTDPETRTDILANIPQGALIVILVDSDTGFVVWTGVATAEVQKNANANTMKARLDYTVTKMMKKIPR